MNRVTEIYCQPERYNPRIRATVSGAWIAVYESGDEVPICRDYEAANKDEARRILESA